MGASVSLNDPVNDTQIPAASSSSLSGSGDTSADLQTQFMNLLVAQMQNQDPTDPMDDSQMTSQLAQISTLSGIENLNTTLGSISGQISTSQSLQASTLVGNGVMIDGTNIQVGSDSSTTPFGVNLSGASTNTTVTISDSTGKEVRTVQLGAQSAGVHSYSWDGTNDAGTAVAAGNYTIAATSTASGGSTITTTPLEYSEVYGVSTDSSGNSQLNLGLLGNVSLSQVVQII